MNSNIQFITKCSQCNAEFPEEELTTTLCSNCQITLMPKSIQQLYSLFISRQNICVIARAGLGKSYLLKFLAEKIRTDPTLPCFDILCPTGSSALNVDGITYHTLFGFKKYGIHGLFFGMNPLAIIHQSSKFIEEKIYNPRFRTSLKKLKIIKILLWDEFSMIPAMHFDAINKLLQVIRNSSEPFGGVQMVLFGDPFQLRPVIGDYIFQSQSWIHMQVFELEGPNYRYTDNNFADMTRMLRLGLMSKEALIPLEQRFIEPDNKLLELYFTNERVDQSN